MENFLYLLACNRLPQFSPRRLLKCLKIWPNLSDLFQASTTQLIALGFPESLIQSIQQFDFKTLDVDLEWMMSPNHHILALDSEHYPKRLKEIPDPPPILYAKGNLDCLPKPALSIVGTRNPSKLGADTAWRFAKELTEAGLVIISGLAAGIDAKAHQGCLAVHGHTVAVVGTGMNVIYPRNHRQLADQIVAEGGVLLSEFPLDSPPKAHHFPQRNRIISGLSAAVLVIEAALRSGSLITARYAMEQNRDVFAIPGSIYHPQSRGCHRLLQEGAGLITTPQELLKEMNFSDTHRIKNISISTEICENMHLLHHIGFELTTVDQIIERSGFSVNEVLCKIVELDLQGWIQVVPGGYMRCR